MSGDSDLTFSENIFNIVATSKETADKLEQLIVNRTPRYSVTLELMEALIEALRTNSELTATLFEENQHIMERVSAAMAKNHPKGYTITNTER